MSVLGFVSFSVSAVGGGGDTAQDLRKRAWGLGFRASGA